MSNYRIIENCEDYSNQTIVRFDEYEVDLDKQFFDIFEKDRPGEVDDIVKKTKDYVLVHTVMPPMNWGRLHPFFNKIKMDLFEGNIFQTPRKYGFKLGDRVTFFRHNDVIRKIENINYYGQDLYVVLRPDCVATRMVDLIEAEKKFLAESGNKLREGAGDEKSAIKEVASNGYISDFTKLVSIIGELYVKNTEKLKRHIRKAYVDCSMYDTIKSRFNKTDEEAEKIFQAFMKIEWLVKEANPKWSYENARNKISVETGIGIEIFGSLSGSYSSFNKHKKEI
jgi:hypothetical protein